MQARLRIPYDTTSTCEMALGSERICDERSSELNSNSAPSLSYRTLPHRSTFAIDELLGLTGKKNGSSNWSHDSRTPTVTTALRRLSSPSAEEATVAPWTSSAAVSAIPSTYGRSSRILDRRRSVGYSEASSVASPLSGVVDRTMTFDLLGSVRRCDLEDVESGVASSMRRHGFALTATFPRTCAPLTTSSTTIVDGSDRRDHRRLFTSFASSTSDGYTSAYVSDYSPAYASTYSTPIFRHFGSNYAQLQQQQQQQQQRYRLPHFDCATTGNIDAVPKSKFCLRILYDISFKIYNAIIWS